MSENMEVFQPEQVAAAQESLPPQRDLEALGEFFKVFGDPTRLKILYALGSGELCVFDLAASTGASVSSVSHHLATLRLMRLVKGRREGRVIYYSLDDGHVNTILRDALTHIKEGNHA